MSKRSAFCTLLLLSTGLYSTATSAGVRLPYSNVIDSLVGPEAVVTTLYQANSNSADPGATAIGSQQTGGSREDTAEGESGTGPSDEPVDNRSIDDIYREVFGSDRPVLASDEYVVRLNGINVGTFRLQPPEPQAGGGWIEGQFIETMITPNLIPEMVARFEGFGASEQVSFASLRASGLDVAFDRQRLVLEVGLPPQMRNRQLINLRARARQGSLDHVERAHISGYLNIRAGIDLLEDSRVRNPGVDRRAIDLDAALRFGPFVLEGEIDFDDRRTERRWRRNDVLLSYDDRDSLVRYEVGDLSIGRRPFQGSPRIAGAAAFRKFSINPYLNYRPVTSRDFELEQGARVEVFVNNLPLRTIDLPSGRYRLQDFSLIPSAINDIRLLVTYPSGRVEELLFPAFYDFELLDEGIRDFGVNVGVPYTVQNGRRDYDFGNYNILAYYRQGLTETLTGGASVEADETFVTLGVEAIWASPIGTFALNAGNDIRNPGPDSGLVTLQYRWRDADRDRDRTIDAFVQLSGREYRTLDQIFGDNLIQTQARIRVGQYVKDTIRAQLFAGYETYHPDIPTSYSVGLSLTGSFGRFQLGGSLEYRRDGDSSGLVGQISFTTSFGKTSVLGSYSTEENSMRAQFTRIEPYGIGAITAGGTVERTDRRDRESLRLGYVGNRFEAGVQQFANNYLTDDADASLVTEFRLGTALVMADGHFALSRPVSNSFAIFTGEGGDIAVDPQTRLGSVESRYIARSGGLGAAVVNNMTPYYNRVIRVDSEDASQVSSVANNLFVLNPDYRSGYSIALEETGGVAIIGNLVDIEGNPVDLAVGTYRVAGRQDDGEPQNIFTNRNGRFYIDDIEPGDEIEITLPGENGVYRIEVPNDALGLVSTDDVIRPAPNAQSSMSLTPGEDR
ncbi:hypothetical protein [Pelagerythrobacter marensis]|uniref:Fimbrial biogenesis outer membrane usher protein n=1 Tax=Pelagerythrobacter marensis TaxID=543877 RepID=A0A0G3X5B6_9SPHN|nr:hypothetical protein [Pelagerythrobacter marensis]AKM06397.1 hypothetical protein AM2010_309 [Pelagerythrobacter marensis]